MQRFSIDLSLLCGSPASMAQISHRLRNLNGNGSDGWEVFNRARSMIAQGTDVVELTIGEHDIGTDARILDAMDRAARAGHTGYASVPGIAALRRAVAHRSQTRTGVPTTTDNVMITPGGQAGLFAAHMVACAPGDTALYLDPYYATYPATLRAAGAQPHALATRAEDGFQPGPRTFEAAPRAASLLVNSPNNPTGAVYGTQAWDAIGTVVLEQDMWLISDEVYETQVWDGAHQSPRALPDLAERTLVVGSMSKSHAMTGSRVGWILGPPEAIDVLIDLANTTTYGVPGFIQHAALWALEAGADLADSIAAPFLRRRNRVADIMVKFQELAMVPSRGAMYVMIDIRATGLSGESFANLLLDTHHIAVMPGESFGTAAAGHVRVALTLPDEALCDAVETLCRFARGLIRDMDRQ